MLDAQFGGARGNLYKPEGPGANWSAPFDRQGFVKKNNTKAADFSDVKARSPHCTRRGPIHVPGGRRSKHASTSISFSVGWP